VDTMEPEEIQTRADLVRFIQLLGEDLIHHEDEWENTDLLRYLQAMSRWVADMDRLFRNVYGHEVPEQPTWALVGQILLAAKYYE